MIVSQSGIMCISDESEAALTHLMLTGENFGCIHLKESN
jgi:hypothetical protein